MLEGGWCGPVEDLVLDAADGLVDPVDDGDVRGSEPVDDLVEHVVGGLLQMPRVALARGSEVIERFQRLVVVRPQEVGAEESIKLVGLDVQAGAVSQDDGRQHQVQAAPPVVDARDMGFHQGIDDGQRVKAEGLTQ